MAYLLVEKFYNFLRVSNNENAISIISGSAKKKKKMNIFTYFYHIATWLLIMELILLGNSYICPTIITSLGRSVYSSSAVTFQELFYLWVVKLNSFVAKLYLYFSDGFQIFSI